MTATKALPLRHSTPPNRRTARSAEVPEIHLSGAVTAAQIVINHIVNGIGTGVYAPGQRLIEADLVRTLGVSRTVVREALRWLAAGGFCDLEPNRGAAIRRLSRKQVRDILTILESFSQLAIREVIGRIHNPKVRREIRNSLAKSREFKRRSRASTAVVAFRDENVRFHDAIYHLTGNAMLAEMRARLRIHILRLEWQGLITGSNSAEWTAGHEETLLAILAGNVQAAFDAKRLGLNRIRDAILSLPDSAYG